ncbi:MAG TPA: DUF58 domain-containing protein [Candidatus Babeliales bacterium]|nr:DUF58 domain-containing protein [Candidatus Babeliales bacterium]
MLSNDVIKKIRRIEIATRRILTGSAIGDSRSIVRGPGFEFDQIREYQIGDDVRYIDWNSSSRANSLLVKQYQQERNRTIIIAIDVSASSLFCSGDQLKSDVMAQVAAVFTLAAEYAKDAVSVLLFSDEIELYIPAGSGRQHTRLIMEKLFAYQSKSKKTRIACALDRLMGLGKPDGILFLISDFIDTTLQNNKKILSLVARKYDFVAVRCLDTNEHALPLAGFITVTDSETGQTVLVDLRKQSGAASLFLKNRLQQQEQLFKRNGVALLDIMVDRPFVNDVIKFFRKRMMK